MPDTKKNEKKYDLILDAFQQLLEEKKYKTSLSARLHSGQASEKAASTTTFPPRKPFWTR